MLRPETPGAPLAIFFYPAAETWWAWDGSGGSLMQAALSCGSGIQDPEGFPDGHWTVLLEFLMGPT